MLVRDDRTDLYESLGFRLFYLGDEAILDVAGFTLDNPRMRNARQAVKRSINFGVTTEVVREADIAPSVVASLRDITVRARHGQREEGFSAALEEPFSVPQPDCLVAMCRDRSGALVGFQRYSLCHGDTKLSADAMRRLPEAPNGTNERMIFEVVQWAQHHGIVELSLNFVAFRGLLGALRRGDGKWRGGEVHQKVESCGRADAVHLHQQVPASLGAALSRLQVAERHPEYSRSRR